MEVTLFRRSKQYIPPIFNAPMMLSHRTNKYDAKLTSPFQNQSKLFIQNTVNVAFDLNLLPMAFPGTKVPIHEKPDKQKVCAPQGVKYWYLGPSQEHYRC